MGSARVQRRLAAGCGADAAQQLVRLGVLEQIAARAGIERAENLLSVRNAVSTTTRVASEAAWMRRVVSMPSIPGMDRSTSATSGRSSRARVAPRAAVPGLADDLHVGVGGDQPREPGPHERVVVDQQDTDHSFKRMLVPRPGVERISSAPPCSRARSSSIRRPRCGRSPAGSEKPRPSSETSIASWVTRTVTRVASAWAATLRSASWAVR